MAFIVCILLACIISFFIIKIYNFVSYKNQAENFKEAAYIYIRKKLDFMPKLLNEIRANIGDTDEIIEIIRIRNEFDESDSIKKNQNLLHECNRLLGIIFQKNPDLSKNSEIISLRNNWHSIDNTLNSNVNLYKSAAINYNNMLSDFLCKRVAKIMGYTEEKF